MTALPMQKLATVLRRNGLVRFLEHYAELFPTSHLKDMVVEEMGGNREIRVEGRIGRNSSSLTGSERKQC